ncbi:hypothetical protein HYY75_13000 [bacterium]|nr:hypothetical protein [bacterium]
MVHPGMVGVTELMCSDGFAGWIERQEDDNLTNLSAFEIYSLFCSEIEGAN